MHVYAKSFAVLTTIAQLTVATSTTADSITITPTRDSTIIQWSPDGFPPNSFLANGQGDIYVGRTNQDGGEAATISIRRGLVHFDVAAAIPAGMQITSATLTLRDVRGRNGDPNVTLHRVLTNWGEGGSFFEGGQGSPAQDDDVTWLHAFYNSATPSASLAWNAPGGDYIEAASAEAVVTDDLGEGQLFAWSGDGLVADLQTWLDTPASNFGWLLHGDESRGQSAKRFNSGESTELPNTPPRLTIEFAPVLAGDYNADSHVDAADYTIWRDRLNTSGPLANETVTPDQVTIEDYAVWKSNFDSSGSGSAASALAVPEPAAATLLVGTLAAAACGFPRLKSHPLISHHGVV